MTGDTHILLGPCYIRPIVDNVTNAREFAIVRSIVQPGAVIPINAILGLYIVFLTRLAIELG